MPPPLPSTSLLEPSDLRQFFDGIADRLESVDTSHATADQLIEPPELSELQQFFADIGYRVEQAEMTQRLLDQKLATGFNVFNLIEPDENKLSDVLALLLDPKGSHGQGDRFLRLLFEKLSLNPSENLNEITVQREAATHGILKYRRRIDVLVEAGVRLAIENKVDSLEQPEQVKDYLDHLRQCAHGQRFALIYLTPNGRQPDSLSRETVEELQQNGTLHCWSYPEELSVWLETCRRACEAERIRNFISDFLAYIESDLKRESENDSETPTDEN